MAVCPVGTLLREVRLVGHKPRLRFLGDWAPGFHQVAGTAQTAGGPARTAGARCRPSGHAVAGEVQA